MTRKEYLAEPARLCGHATVLAIEPGTPAIVRLDSTIFHAQGGGQKADRGQIGPARVVHVSHNGDNVDHSVDDAAGLVVGAEVSLQVDAVERRRNAAMHSAGHLLAGVVESLYPALTAVAGHQWPGEGRVEFTGGLGAQDISVEAINARLATDIASALPVAVVGDPFTNRAIRIGDYAAIACGGTHVGRLDEIAHATLRSVKARGGKLRLGYEAAPRA